MIAFVAAALLAASDASSSTLEAKPLSLGKHHCHELQSKAPSAAATNTLTYVYDLSETGRAAYEQACAARGGVASREKCPRTNAVFVCAGDARNATALTILYQGSADIDLLTSACKGGAAYAGRRVFAGLRDRPGRSIWGSCLVE